MSKLDEVIQNSLKGGRANPEKEAKDEMEKISSGLKVLHDAKSHADAVSGAPEARAEAERSRQEADQAKADLDRERWEQLQKTAEDNKQLWLSATNESKEERERLRREAEVAKSEADKAKWDFMLDRFAALEKAKLSKETSFPDELIKFKEAATAVGWGPAEKPEKPEKPSSELPASVALQIKKMEIDTSLLLEEIRDKRADRDRQWELEKIKWADDREMKHKEMEANIQIQQERNQFLGEGIQRVGRVIALAATEGGIGGGTGGGVGKNPTPPPGVATSVIEAGVGEFGDADCPACGGKIPIAADAKQAVCSGCSLVYPIKRVRSQASKEVMEESPAPASQDKSGPRG